VQIQEMISGNKFERDLVDPQRRYVKEGKFTEYFPDTPLRKGSSEKKVKKKGTLLRSKTFVAPEEVYFILFSDILVICTSPSTSSSMFSSKSSAKKLDYKYRVLLAGATVTLLKNDDSTGIVNGFRLVTKKSTNYYGSDLEAEVNAFFTDLAAQVKEQTEKERLLDEKKTEVAQAKAAQARALLGSKYKSMGRISNSSGDLTQEEKKTEVKEAKEELPWWATPEAASTEKANGSDSEGKPQLRSWTLKRTQLTQSPVQKIQEQERAESHLQQLEMEEKKEREEKEKKAEEKSKLAKDLIQERFQSLRVSQDLASSGALDPPLNTSHDALSKKKYRTHVSRRSTNPPRLNAKDSFADNLM